MDDSSMIGLEIIVGVDLPSAVNEPVPTRGQLHSRDIAVADQLGQAFQRFAERRATWIEVHKDKSSPDLDSELWQTGCFFAEALDSVKLRSAKQSPVKRIAPAVVTALKHSARAASR